jgi:hypothetical protein
MRDRRYRTTRPLRILFAERLQFENPCFRFAVK